MAWHCSMHACLSSWAATAATGLLVGGSGTHEAHVTHKAHGGRLQGSTEHPASPKMLFVVEFRTCIPSTIHFLQLSETMHDGTQFRARCQLRCP